MSVEIDEDELLEIVGEENAVDVSPDDGTAPFRAQYFAPYSDVQAVGESLPSLMARSSDVAGLSKSAVLTVTQDTGAASPVTIGVFNVSGPQQPDAQGLTLLRLIGI